MVAQVLRTGLRELTHRPQSQMAGLDGLRVIAVILVICTHYVNPEWIKIGGPESSLTQFPLFYYGWTGVDLFFVLSGFLIGKQLWREVDHHRSIQIGRFLLRRGFRIWPLYFCGLVYLTAVGINIHWTDVAFLANYVPGQYPRNWSLATEDQFYLIIPFLLIAIVRWVRKEHQVIPFLVLLILVPIARAIEWERVQNLGVSSQAASDLMQYPIHLHCEGLLIGLIIALAYTRYPHWFVRKKGNISRVGVGVLASGVVLGLVLHSIDRRLFSFLALGLIFGGIMFFVMTDGSFVSKPLRAKMFYSLSKLSYGMYLNHFLVFPGSTRWVAEHMAGRGFSTPVAFWSGLLFGTAISVAVAAGTFVLIESPFLQLRSWLDTRPVRKQVPVRRPEMVFGSASSQHRPARHRTQ